MTKALDILTLVVLWLIVSATASSCRSGHEPGRDEDTDGSRISFKFTIYTEDTPQSTRALGVWEEDAANVAERILNADDMRILFFDQSGRLLKSVRPSDVDYVGSDVTNDGYYTVSASFTHEYFDNFDDNANVAFTVMILANLEGIGGRYTDYAPGDTFMQDVADSFPVSDNYFPTVESGIPMYGVKGFYVPKETLMQGTDAPVAGDIDMIRALCKIEVRDRITNPVTGPDGQRYPIITNVEMVSWLNRGYLRPRFDDYPSGLREANIYPAGATTDAVAARTVNDKYIFYCPEADVADMRFRVTAIVEPGQAPRQFETGLEPFRAGIGKELVRNHIYRFDVKAFNTILDLDVNVSDWTVQTDEFELDNIVSVEPDGFLKWEYDGNSFAVTTETYNGQQEEQLSILNGTTGYATGRFTILSPRGATWRAYFIPGENGVDAFEFVDTDTDGNVVPGSQRVYAEGLVGEQATIHIRGKGAADSYRHWAELVIEVRTVDGTVLYAPLTPAMSSRFIIYRENKL